MHKPDQNSVREARQTFDLSGAAGVAASAANKPLRAKVFKSGNSLALRLPKALGLETGMELEITTAAGGGYLLNAVAPTKRKFDIDKIWGCAVGSGLQLIKDEDRVFEERPLLWDDPAWRAKHMPGK